MERTTRLVCEHNVKFVLGLRSGAYDKAILDNRKSGLLERTRAKAVAPLLQIVYRIFNSSGCPTSGVTLEQSPVVSDSALEANGSLNSFLEGLARIL